MIRFSITRAHAWRVLLLALTLAACGDNQRATIWVHVPAELDAGARYAVDDLKAELALITGERVAEKLLAGPACADGQLHVLYLGHRHDERGGAAASRLAAQEYEVRERRCGGSGREVILRGGSLLAGQWAAYDLLQRLGVRYFHPEQTLYPTALEWPADPIEVRESPAYFRRSMHAHRTHPIELSSPIFLGELDMAGYQRRWVDWNIKLRQTELDGWDAVRLGTYPYERGFGRTAGFNLLNAQQGGRPLLDPDDPRPESEQIASAIDERLAPVEGLPPPFRFGFQFNPSEFTEADHYATVERLIFITDYITGRYPGVQVSTINHGTWAEPGPLGVRFFDLPQFAPPALGVQVHTLMFYDLERPAAGVYGNPSFAHMLAWTIEQAEIRRIVHYPESSWWLTFDLPVPLYLAPVTLEARQHDLDLLAPHMATAEEQQTGVWGHHLFTSGQEWGYWMIDYCVAQMVWDLGFTYRDCLDDITGRFAGGEVIRAVLDEVTARQIDDLRDPELLRFLVGSDDETETAFDIGIVFHPLPPAPGAVLGWDDAAVQALETSSLAPLRAMAADYAAWAARVEATLAGQSAAAAPWVREIRDGLAVFGLRAAHAVRVYETALALRAAIRAGDAAAIEAARAGVDEARAITESARVIVRAREQDYRYPPALTIEGDEPGTEGAIENETIYPYRYLSRTHRMFYWERPDDQLATLFGDGLELVGVSRRILALGTPLAVNVLADDVTSLMIDWGDGEQGSALDPHVYAAQGLYAWVLDVVRTAGVLHHEDVAAVVARRLAFPKGSLQIEEPTGAAIIESLLPGFVIGLGDDGQPFMAVGRVDGGEAVAARGSIVRRVRSGASSGPADMPVSLSNVGDLTVFGAVITVGDGTGPDARTLAVTGELSTDEIVATLVSVGGFDEPGARQIVADILGYTARTLPPRVAFRLSAVGSES